MRASTLVSRLCLVAAGFTLGAAPTLAQTIDDGIMLPRHALFAGNLYSYDSWDEYWEGSLRRDNGNIGTITTRTNTWFGNYGITDRLNVIVAVPYVWTRASRGILQGMQGIQDITLAAKYRLADAELGPGRLRAIAVASGGIPLTDYTPDYQPLSIGMGSKRIAARGTLNYQSGPGWFANLSSAYAWRGGVTLDRPYYFTDGRLFFTDQVDMPNVLDYVAGGGFNRRGWMATLSFSQQRTLGGGDIRRQDMPFVSNRMNFSRVGGTLMAPIPKLRQLSAQVSCSYVIRGRNVGQATTFTGGLMYTLNGDGGRGR